MEDEDDAVVPGFGSHGGRCLHAGWKAGSDRFGHVRDVGRYRMLDGSYINDEVETGVREDD